MADDDDDDYDDYEKLFLRPLDAVARGQKLKPKIILLLFEFFIKNSIAILAFFETIWLKCDCCL